MSEKALSLEQKVLRAHRTLKRPPREVWLALSGGLDSMVMAEILFRWSRAMKLKITVCHVHHGKAASRKQKRFRDRARKFVGDWAKTHELEFVTNARLPDAILKSEQDWRAWREECFAQWNPPALAMAHHQDDLLETRLIRLIRGSGNQGLRSMSPYARGRWRPLLHVSRKEIGEYAQARSLKWLEDPSNAEDFALRNWMRRNWLPSLEGKRPGSMQSLARSLENLAPVESVTNLSFMNHVGLRRDSIAGCTKSERGELLARYLKELGLKGYSKAHVNEILKRLDTSPNESEFMMLGTVFKISHDLLWASRV